MNSIRSPSSANNLVGIRPTKGLISLDGILPVSFTQDAVGPIARTVEDAAIMLDVMAGSDKTKPGAAYSDALVENGLKGARIGVLQNLFGTQQIHEEVNTATHAAMEEMKNLGATLVPINIPGLDTDKLIADLDVQKYEIKEELNRYFSTYRTPVKTLEEFLAKDSFHASVESALQGAQAVENPLTRQDYLARLKKLETLKKQILQVMDEHDVDVLLYPHQKRLVVPVGEAQVDRNGIVGALTGFPAITFQGGFSAPTASADWRTGWH
ncbi:amidase family protein [Paenibacillus xerothermodurans]|uniref:Amidase domain-containing protein n=1 Tax=Paenibacillus xerothermodurans TaxID=1977292 RepID=A0A2W1NQQ7_PAEXE|nr:amidase family protein [Paenibacillus xerothermodurans]PZE20066.1 hypothetical protein CBW46_015410 [Paenibacillus xerothermodurans]